MQDNLSDVLDIIKLGIFGDYQTQYAAVLDVLGVSFDSDFKGLLLSGCRL